MQSERNESIFGSHIEYASLGEKTGVLLGENVIINIVFAAKGAIVASRAHGGLPRRADTRIGSHKTNNNYISTQYIVIIASYVAQMSGLE